MWGGDPITRRPDAERERILTLIRQKYSGPVGIRFGPTLAAEHLASEDGLQVHHDTLRRWMLVEGLWSRARKHAPHRSRRARKAHFGELVQLDGSFHLWYEGRAPQGCLMTLVDDATSHTLGRLGDQETIWAAVRVLRCWIETSGVPHALYTDWKNVYVRPPNAKEQATGAVPRTQFGRMCAALDIRIIAASSPQAKGRVERNHGTHQDRLVKKLRRLKIGDAGAANAFLEATYLPEHNTRFAQAAAVAGRFSPARAGPGGPRSDLPTRGDPGALQRLGSPVDASVFSSRAPERGGARAQYRPRPRNRGRDDRNPLSGPTMQWTELAARPEKAPPPSPGRRLARRGARMWIIPGDVTRKAEERELALGRAATPMKRPMDAAGAVDAETAPTAPWKTRGGFSTSAHRPRSLEGDISISLRRGTFLFRVGRGRAGCGASGIDVEGAFPGEVVARVSAPAKVLDRRDQEVGHPHAVELLCDRAP